MKSTAMATPVQSKETAWDADDVCFHRYKVSGYGDPIKWSTWEPCLDCTIERLFTKAIIEDVEREILGDKEDQNRILAASAVS